MLGIYYKTLNYPHVVDTRRALLSDHSPESTTGDHGKTFKSPNDDYQYGG